MIIRWLGAFRKKGTLLEALRWEFTQREIKILAAERLSRGRSKIHHARVGLLVANRALVRKFRSDVWSETTEKGLLVRQRRENEAFSWHRECWVRPHFRGIVIKSRITARAWHACVTASRTFYVPLLKLTRDGQLVPATEENAIRRK